MWMLPLVVAAVSGVMVCPPQFASTGDWSGLQYKAANPPGTLVNVDRWLKHDFFSLQSPLTPGILVRMKSDTLVYFSGLGSRNAQPPTYFWINTPSGPRAFRAGQSVPGIQMSSSWIVTSFQEAKGWEQFDVPWFISLQRRPVSITLNGDGLTIKFREADTGYAFSMPLYGYEKLPQKTFDFATVNDLPANPVHPWDWVGQLPDDVVKRCDWWARTSKAYPAGFQESFSVSPQSDEIHFRQNHSWLMISDDWGTQPQKLASISPSLALALKYPGFPVSFGSPVHDAGYFTAFGPVAGVIGTDQVDYSMKVLQYLHELEWPVPSEMPDAGEQTALALIRKGMSDKFPAAEKYIYDHGGLDNLCWALMGDVWYSRVVPYVPNDIAWKAKASLRTYMSRDVLIPHTPFHGKYILEGPGIGSWGTWGDAGKFMTNALQAIWAYGQFADGWPLIRERWPLIRRFYITPQESDWISYGRYSVAELGDDAAPSSAFARMAWVVGDLDSYLFGSYMFSRQLVHHYLKQKAAGYFYSRQPYNSAKPMPSRVYLTNLWGGTKGWQLDGPLWGDLPSGEHQSANRWFRFQDPDVGRFYRDYLSADVEQELEWYTRTTSQGSEPVYRAQDYRNWLIKDLPHNLTSLGRLQSFLVNSLGPSNALVQIAQRPSGWPAADIAAGYALLHATSPVKRMRIVPRNLEQSPYVPGLERENQRWEVVNTVQECAESGPSLEPRWHGWGPNGGPLSFGRVEGSFPGSVPGLASSVWLAYGGRVYWADTIRSSPTSQSTGNPSLPDRTPVAIFGPFPNTNDNEITESAYPPEKPLDLVSVPLGADTPFPWRLATLDTGRRIDLRKELHAPGRGARLAYIHQLVWSPVDTDAYLLARHQGGIVAWINEHEIIRFHSAHRPSEEDATRSVCRLRRGWNRILLKVESFTGEYLFQFMLTAPDGRPIPSLKYAAQPVAFGRQGKVRESPAAQLPA